MTALNLFNYFSRDRVLPGLRNARAKGKILGRVRKRNSVLIESLLDAGLSFREISRVAGCSHGSVSAQKKEWLAKKKLREQEQASQKLLTGSTTDELNKSS